MILSPKSGSNNQCDMVNLFVLLSLSSVSYKVTIFFEAFLSVCFWLVYARAKNQNSLI